MSSANLVTLTVYIYYFVWLFSNLVIFLSWRHQPWFSWDRRSVQPVCDSAVFLLSFALWFSLFSLETKSTHTTKHNRHLRCCPVPMTTMRSGDKTSSFSLLQQTAQRQRRWISQKLFVSIMSSTAFIWPCWITLYTTNLHTLHLKLI